MTTDSTRVPGPPPNRAIRISLDGRELIVFVHDGLERDHEAAPTLSPTRPAELSELDCRIVELVRDGHTNRSIAARLALSESSVRKRLNRIFRRLGVESRVQLALLFVGP